VKAGVRRKEVRGSGVGIKTKSFLRLFLLNSDTKMQRKRRS
jgi:hypothetical protein